ncbi:helix-turn-helix transcriptional regulator [Salana multivorans]
MSESDGRRSDPIGSPSPVVDLVVGPGEADNRYFGELLESLRWKAGLSRADAARRLGFSSEYLRLIETGKRTPALGQMPNLLAVYGAEGVVGEVSPQGYRQDLAVMDPRLDDQDGPVLVEFTSRIREARRTELGGSPDEVDDMTPERYPYPDVNRSTQLGLIVSLLVRASDHTLSSVRTLLEEELSGGDGR